MLVVMPGNCGGFGMPHRIMTSSRSPSLTRTTGATWSGKIAGSGGRLPVLSLVTLNRSRIAFWLVLMEYRLHIDGTYGAGRRIRTSKASGVAPSAQPSPTIAQCLNGGYG